MTLNPAVVLAIIIGGGHVVVEWSCDRGADRDRCIMSKWRPQVNTLLLLLLVPVAAFGTVTSRVSFERNRVVTVLPSGIEIKASAMIVLAGANC